MPKRKDPANYQPPPLDLDFAPFDEDALERLISATRFEARLGDPGVRKRTLLRLNTAALWYRNAQGFNQRPTPSTEVRVLKSITSALGNLEALLPIEWEENGFTGERDQPHVARGVERLLVDELNELLGAGGDNAVADWIEILDDADCKQPADELLLLLAVIAALVRRASEKAIAAKDEPEDQRGLVADKAFTASLVDIYVDLFDRPPGLSRDALSNEPGGPLLRFVSACYGELEKPQDSEPLYARIRLALKERDASD